MRRRGRMKMCAFGGAVAALAAATVVAGLVAACSSSNSSGCTTDAQCKADRICVKGVCTAPPSGTGVPGTSPSGKGSPPSGGGTGFDASGGGGGGGGGLPDDDGGGLADGTNIFCTAPDQGICYCGHDQSFGGTTSQSCTASLVAPGATCCASAGWPSSGYCTCNGPALCQEDYDTCQCDLAGSPMTGDTQVSSCTYSGVCCQTADAFGTTGCACFTETNIQCDSMSGWSQTSSCGQADPGCGPGTTQTDSCRP